MTEKLALFGWRPVDPPQRPVLLVNPRSGDGTAARLRLAERARDVGIEAVILTRAMTARSWSVRPWRAERTRWGWLVATALLRSWPPLRPRTAFPSSVFLPGRATTSRSTSGWTGKDCCALDAFTDGVERHVDMAEVNGRPFLANNVSLGIYGEAVRRALIAMPRCARSYRPRRRSSLHTDRPPR